MADYNRPTSWAYTKEKKYSYIDPTTGEIVYSDTPPSIAAEGTLPPSAIADVTERRGRVWTSPQAMTPFNVEQRRIRAETDYGDFQIEFTKELDAMETMSSAMLQADKGNAAGDPDLMAYATAKHQLRSQEILGYKRQTESALDIIFQKPWLSNREKWNMFEQTRAKIRKPIATPEEVPTIKPTTDRLTLAGLQGRIPAAGVPTTPAKKTWGWPTLFKPAYRVRPEQSATMAQMQSAPDMAIDPYWRNIPDDMKPLVWRAFREGDSPEQIINELRNRGIIK